MKRPFSVTLTGWVVLILTSWNAIRLWTSIAWSEVLTEFSVRIAPAASAVIAAIWVVGGLILLWSMWRKKAWSAKLLLGMAAAYTVWYWSERLIFQNPRTNVPFAVILNLILLVFIYFASRSLTREAYERNIENPKTE